MESNWYDSLSQCVGDLEEILNLINNDQRKYIRDNYNISIAFSYCKVEVDGNDVVVFSMDQERFGNFSYYLGFEYEKEHIAFKIILDRKVYVGYYLDESSRAEGILDKLKALEMDDPDEA